VGTYPRRRCRVRSLKETLRWTAAGLLGFAVVALVLVSDPAVARAEVAPMPQPVPAPPPPPPPPPCKTIISSWPDPTVPGGVQFQFSCVDQGCNAQGTNVCSGPVPGPPTPAPGGGTVGSVSCPCSPKPPPPPGQPAPIPTPVPPPNVE
jgi:hypothetical protein